MHNSQWWDSIWNSPRFDLRLRRITNRTVGQDGILVLNCWVLLIRTKHYCRINSSSLMHSERACSGHLISWCSDSHDNAVYKTNIYCSISDLREGFKSICIQDLGYDIEISICRFARHWQFALRRLFKKLVFAMEWRIAICTCIFCRNVYN